MLKVFLLLVFWVIPEKIHKPTTGGILENLMGAGLTTPEIQMGGGGGGGGGGLNLTQHPGFGSYVH